MAGMEVLEQGGQREPNRQRNRCGGKLAEDGFTPTGEHFNVESDGRSNQCCE